MKFPTMDEFAKSVAEKALDEFEYKGKTLRQWMEIIIATDINVATKDGTNLAEVGTDCISREKAIEALEKWLHGLFGITEADGTATIFKTIRQLPPIQPRRGQWIDDGSELGCQCSQCGKTLDEYINCRTEYMTLTEIPKFCPNCGADMREVTE